MHTLLIALALSLTSFFQLTSTVHAGSCELPFPRAQLCASVQWDSAPSAARQNAFTLRFWNLETGTEAGPYISPAAELFVKLWMPSMGHGSRPVTLVPARDNAGGVLPGVYRVEKVSFSMRGDWDVQIQLRQQNQVLEQAVLSLFL